jgi:sodium transport system ATP-binding protein
MIEVEGLTKVYPDGRGGGLLALSEASFRCQPGRIFGLLGPNGAGKTTTLRILSTVLRPTAGRALVRGHDVTKEPEAVRRSLGFLSGSTGVYERMTAREMIEYFGRLYDMDEDRLRQRVDELLDLLDAHSFAHRLCGQLSTGQRQKVSIARTIVHDPPVLIFDEPTSGLDILVARGLVEFIASLRDAGRTVIISTHIMSVAEKLCDDVAIINGGVIMAQGTLAELKERYECEHLEDVFFCVAQSGPASSSVFPVASGSAAGPAESNSP